MGRTLLDRQVTTLRSKGIDDVHIATGYRADQIEALGFETSFNERFNTTNMVESLFSARAFIENCKEDLVIAYGDIIYREKNLAILLSSHEEVSLMIDEDWLALWSLRLENPLDDAETLMMDDLGYVSELGKKPEDYSKIQGQYTGLIKISSEKIPDFINFYDNIDRTAVFDNQDFDNMYMTSFLQLLINSGWKVKAAIVKKGWLEVDSVDDLTVYENMALKGQLGDYFDQ